MKCINCFREIADGLKFCPKCGFKQPDDREAYEQEHPELADALPEEEILEKLEHASIVPLTAMSREEFVESIASDPHRESIVKMVDEGIIKFGLEEKNDQERWIAKCSELISNKQGFYPYFVQLLSQQYDMARDLLFNQASYGMDFATASEKKASDNELPAADMPDLPPPLPTHSETRKQHDELQKKIQDTTSYMQSGDSTGKTAVICPICYSRLLPGTKECPNCHQLLDWKGTPNGGAVAFAKSHNSPTQKAHEEKDEDGNSWIVPLLIVAGLVVILIISSRGCNESNNAQMSDSIATSYDYYSIPAESAPAMDTEDAAVSPAYQYSPAQEEYDEYNEYDEYEEYEYDEYYDGYSYSY